VVVVRCDSELTLFVVVGRVADIGVVVVRCDSELTLFVVVGRVADIHVVQCLLASKEWLWLPGVPGAWPCVNMVCRCVSGLVVVCCGSKLTFLLSDVVFVRLPLR
jgi:hypothetical protein